MTHADKAKKLFLDGYNCSQAVVGAFADELGLSHDTAMMISSSFGGGMGRLREVCGTVTGAFMVLGLMYGYTNPKDNKSKSEHYKRIQLFADKFKELNGSIICRELLGLSEIKSEPNPEIRTEQYYKKRPCAELCYLSAEIIEKYFVK